MECDTDYCIIRCHHSYGCYEADVYVNDVVSFDLQCHAQHSCNSITVIVNGSSSAYIDCVDLLTGSSWDGSCPYSSLTLIADTALIRSRGRFAISQSTIDGELVDSGFVTCFFLTFKVA